MSRLNFLDSLIALQADGLDRLDQIELSIHQLDTDEQHLLAGERPMRRTWLTVGLLNYFAGEAIYTRTKSRKLAAGFIRASFSAYQAAEAFGLCQFLHARFPDDCPADLSAPQMPSQVFGIENKPAVPRRASLPVSIKTTSSKDTQSTEDMASESLNGSTDILDTLT